MSINGTDVSDHVVDVTVTMSKNDVDITNFGGGGSEVQAGLKKDMFQMTLQQDFSASSIDQILYPLYNNETEFAIEVRPTQSAVSSTNPKYTGTCVLLDYVPVDGKPGEVSKSKIKFPAQRAGITRATS
ncbi:hypothetical protein [Streptomyces sp. NPDC055085]